MNKLMIGAAGMLAMLSSTKMAVPASTTNQDLRFSRHLSMRQVRCLRALLRISNWRYLPKSESEMMKIAQAATATLNGRGRPDYIYVVEGRGWCGTAGCPLLIGELEPDGTCRLLYDDMGGTTFTVLGRRDYGYHRIFTPCEARFDGRRYQAVHEDCPSPGAPR